MEVTGETPMLLAYQTTAALLGALFLFYGMDIRRKSGACDFVARGWQLLMKLCAFALLTGFGVVVTRMREPGALAWAGLGLAAAGTACVVAAKRALGRAHTFTGQYLAQPRLVTNGIYARTRNPLYFGVFLCELGALLVFATQAPVQWPEEFPYLFGLVVFALAYAVSFNLAMARREAAYLERCFTDDYRSYRARVPFLVPFTKAG